MRGREGEGHKNSSCVGGVLGFSGLGNSNSLQKIRFSNRGHLSTAWGMDPRESAHVAPGPDPPGLGARGPWPSNMCAAWARGLGPRPGPRALAPGPRALQRWNRFSRARTWVPDLRTRGPGLGARIPCAGPGSRTRDLGTGPPAPGRGPGPPSPGPGHLGPGPRPGPEPRAQGIGRGPRAPGRGGGKGKGGEGRGGGGRLWAILYLPPKVEPVPKGPTQGGTFSKRIHPRAPAPGPRTRGLGPRTPGAGPRAVGPGPLAPDFQPRAFGQGPGPGPPSPGPEP